MSDSDSHGVVEVTELGLANHSKTHGTAHGLAHGTAGGNSSAYEAAGELLRALAAPIRIAIITELGAGSRCVHEIVAAVGAPQPLVSQHLRVLRGAGIVRGERRGREIAYSLTDDHIGHIVADAITHAREPR